MKKFNPGSYDIIAREVFAPIYPYIADIILEKGGISNGVCLDAGCGGGYLGLALAEKTDMGIFLLDSSAEMIGFAEQNIIEKDMLARVSTIHAGITAIPLEDSSVDLVVSRGSVFFWQDIPGAFREIFRIMKPGGFAFIGGGLGTPEMRNKILEEMKKRDPEWTPHFNRKDSTDDIYVNALAESGIRHFTTKRDDSGFWIELRKEAV